LSSRPDDRLCAAAAVRQFWPDELSAHARATDPQTSHDAAASIPSDKIRASQQAVLSVLRVHGPMDDTGIIEICMLAQPSQSPSGIRTRRSELVAKGLIADSGERRTLASGRKAIIWTAK
jgi:hypothetical protein